MPPARSATDLLRVLELKQAGRTDGEISALTTVPVNTIRAWRRGRVSHRGRLALAGIEPCSVCGSQPHEFSALPATVYAYLLGIYLGDGCLSRAGRTWSLRITLDAAYPGIIEEVCQVIATLRGRAAKAYPSRRDRSVVVTSTWLSWTCLFPQHGPGKKHLRPIELRDWQQALVARAPGALLRGLIHTDGWRGVNRVVAKGRQYEYPRYQFSNRSDDIRMLFTHACDELGIEWRQWTRYHVSVAKKESVASLDSFVGPKT